MDQQKRRTIEAWIDQAGNQLGTAREHLSHLRCPEAVQAAQQCAELSIKALLAYLGVEFPRTHGVNRAELARIASEIRERHLLEHLAECAGLARRLPRLLCLVNFWAEFYTLAKYGIQDGARAGAAVRRRPSSPLALGIMR